MFKIPLFPGIEETSLLGKALINGKKMFSKIKENSPRTDPLETIKKLPQVNNTDETALYFLHIPKTAGTSLLTILDDKFHSELICNKHDWGELLNDLPKNFSELKLFRGHFYYGFHHQFSKKPIYITMLRDPIQQLPSHYEQSRRNYRRRFNKEPAEDSLLSYLTHPRRRLVAKDNQSRHIAIDIDAVQLIKNMNETEFGDFTRFNFQQFKQPKLSEQKLFALAKKHLEEFAFVGITERFEESMQLLCYTFGWKPLRDIPYVNVASNQENNKNKLAPEELKAINDCSTVDRQLYSYAFGLFEKRYQEMLESLKKQYYETSLSDLKDNDLVYELLERHYQKTYWKNKTKFEMLHYDFSQPLMGTGWYPREKAPLVQKFYRWTGPTTDSTIDLPISANNDMILRVQVIMSMAVDILNSLQLEVNKNRVEITKSNESIDGKTIFEGKIPLSILKKNENMISISFHVNRTESPHDLNPESTDHRKLGLAFQWIEIKSAVD